MVSSKHVAVLATSLLGTAAAGKCKPKTTFQTVTTTGTWLTGAPAPSSEDSTWLTGVGAPSSSVDGTWVTGFPAPSSDDGSSLTGVGAPSSSTDGTWLTGVGAPSSSTDDAYLTGVPAPSSTLTGPWLGSSDTESIPEPSSTSPALGSVGKTVPMGSGGIVPLKCFPSLNEGKDCFANGFVDMYWMDETYTGSAATIQDCLQACSAFKGCTAFSNDDGVCFLGTRPWAEARFLGDPYGKGAKTWTEASCLTCRDDSILALDFEDGYVDDWTMDLADMDLSWFWDSPAVPSTSDRALRIGEPGQVEGEGGEGAQARLNYGVTFPLEAGKTYSLGYQMRVERNLDDEKNYDAITFMISTNDEIIFESTPEKSATKPILGLEKFTPRDGEEGEATLSIVVTGTGNGYDYYFDHLFVTL